MDVLEGKSGILFVMGNYIGLDNVFDLQYVPKLEKYCTWDEINEILEKHPNFKLGWHTWSHPDLTKLNMDEIIKEITPPFPMDYFAYPYGNYNDLAMECVRSVGYKYAWSVVQGTKNTDDENYNYKLYRNYI
jgi:peptidoglycan/xylan/chitin deacetylase (PgdA/CDA1 family)